MHYYKVECSYNGKKNAYYISSENKLKPNEDGYIPLPISLVEKLFKDYTFIDSIEELEYHEWEKGQLEGVGYGDVL